MKFVYLLSALCLFSLNALAQSQQDSVFRADSLQRKRLDSARQQSPLFRKQNEQRPASMQYGLPDQNKKVNSQYQYTKDGQIMGGNTTLQVGKPKKKKKG